MIKFHLKGILIAFHVRSLQCMLVHYVKITTRKYEFWLKLNMVFFKSPRAWGPIHLSAELLSHELFTGHPVLSSSLLESVTPDSRRGKYFNPGYWHPAPFGLGPLWSKLSNTFKCTTLHLPKLDSNQLILRHHILLNCQKKSPCGCKLFKHGIYFFLLVTKQD